MNDPLLDLFVEAAADVLDDPGVRPGTVIDSLSTAELIFRVGRRLGPPADAALDDAFDRLRGDVTVREAASACECVLRGRNLYYDGHAVAALRLES